MADSPRQTFTTTIRKDIAKKFKIACLQNDINMNDVLEAFMLKYISGEIKIERLSK